MPARMTAGSRAARTYQITVEVKRSGEMAGIVLLCRTAVDEEKAHGLNLAGGVSVVDEFVCRDGEAERL